MIEILTIEKLELLMFGIFAWKKKISYQIFN